VGRQSVCLRGWLLYLLLPLGFVGITGRYTFGAVNFAVKTFKCRYDLEGIPLG